MPREEQLGVGERRERIQIFDLSDYAYVGRLVGDVLVLSGLKWYGREESGVRWSRLPACFGHGSSGLHGPGPVTYPKLSHPSNGEALICLTGLYEDWRKYM